jgi:hypothetical protein
MVARALQQRGAWVVVRDGKTGKPRTRASAGVRWRRKPLVGDEEAPARQTPVAHHQVLHALGFPLASTLGWDAFPREPLRHLAIIVADLSHRCLDKGRVGVSVIVGQFDQCAGSAAGESTRPLGTHVVKPCFPFCIKLHGPD